MPRFFFNPKDKSNTKISLSGNDVSHISTVLRLGIGEMLELCDGEGNDYLALIESIEGDEIIADAKFIRSSYSETSYDVTLYQSISKGEKMDEVVQKCVELGVRRIVPLISQRTVVKLNNFQDAQKKTERWAKIAKEAAKQSGRGIIPEVTPPLSFCKALRDKGQALGIVASEYERTISLEDIFKGRDVFNRSVAVLAGPEGGWEQSELKEAQECGWIPFTLGPRVLRTETAGMTVISIIMFLAGEMKWKDPAMLKWHSVH
jgi:16S rRNA (uracil1498-N3)-methyltransferase